VTCGQNFLCRCRGAARGSLASARAAGFVLRPIDATKERKGVWMLGSRKSRDATHFATDGPAPRRYDGYTTGSCACHCLCVRSEYSNVPLVGDGVLQPAPRSANLDSAHGGMQLFATEAWRAAPLLLTHSVHS